MLSAMHLQVQPFAALLAMDSGLFQPILENPASTASATSVREFESMQVAKSKEHACNMAAINEGFAFANPSPKRSSIDRTTSRKYLSAVIGAWFISVFASTAILFSQKWTIVQEGGAA